MKLFLLIATMILLFSRLRNTPQMISKKIYTKRTTSKIDSIRDVLENHSEKENSLIYICTIALVSVMSMFLVIYYKLIGEYVATSFRESAGVSLFIILSLFQMIITTVSAVLSIKKCDQVFKRNFEWLKFSFGFNLFVLVLDYVYYLIAIYYLVVK